MSRPRRPGPLDIAIVGMACRFPGASDLAAFAESTLAGVAATTDVPSDCWSPESWLDDAARAALADSGLASGVSAGLRVEMIVGRDNDFDRGNPTRLELGRIAAQTVAILQSLHPKWTDEDWEAVRRDLLASLPPFSATAGPDANRPDWLGASMVVDAKSASALVALDLGARSLAEGRADLVLVGAVSFLEQADGVVPGAGVGLVVLKRRLDAERAGDRIYAVVRGVGVSGVGRRGDLNPSAARGQARAIRRAYRMARIDPTTVGLVEVQGLGVPFAARAELRALRATFPPIARGRRVLGAVSERIGQGAPLDFGVEVTTSHPNPPPQGGRGQELNSLPLVGTGWGGGASHRLSQSGDSGHPKIQRGTPPGWRV